MSSLDQQKHTENNAEFGRDPKAEISSGAERSAISRTSRVLLLLWIVVFLFLPYPAWRLLQSHLDTSNQESRKLAVFPLLSQEGVTVENYPIYFENWLNDHLPFRNQLIQANSMADFFVFHDTISSNAILGKDGWIFYANKRYMKEAPINDYLGINLFSEEELASIAQNFMETKEIIEADGGQFLIVLSPSKMSIYPEQLPDRFGEPASYKRLHQLADYLGEHTDIDVLLPAEVLLRSKEEHPDQPMYYKYDTHENHYGFYLSSGMILDYLGMEPLPPFDFDSLPVTEAGGNDLARQLHLANVLTDDTDYSVYDMRRHSKRFEVNEQATEMRHTNENGDADPRKLLMICDSFGAGMLPYLADYFNESYMHYFTYYTPDVYEREKGDIVIFEVTERLIGSVPEFHLQRSMLGD